MYIIITILITNSTIHVDINIVLCLLLLNTLVIGILSCYYFKCIHIHCLSNYKID